MPPTTIPPYVYTCYSKKDDKDTQFTSKNIHKIIGYLLIQLL